MKKIIDTWQKDHTNVQVKGQYIAQDYYTKIQTQVAGGTPPDVGIADYSRLISYAKGGILLPLDDFISRDKFPLDKLVPGAVAQYRWHEGDFDTGGEGGTMYGIPADAQGFIFAYNKKLSNGTGVTYPTDDWTWDDLLAAAKAITKPDANQWGVYAPRLDVLWSGNFECHRREFYDA